MSELEKVDIASFFPEGRREQFENCTLIAARHVIERTAINAPPSPGPFRDYRIEILDSNFKGRVDFLLGPGGGSVTIESGGPINASFRMWRDATVRIGRGTTINKARLVCDHADVDVGQDGLWSDEIIVQSNDQHGIIDLTSGELINGGRRRIVIGDHVWIGRRSVIMPDVEVGHGAILATGAVLTTDMAPHTVFAGVPARKIRDNTTWSRTPYGLTRAEQALLEALHRDNADEK